MKRGGVPFLVLLFAIVMMPATTMALTWYGPTPYLTSTDSPFVGVDFSGGFFYLEDFEDQLFNAPGTTVTANSAHVARAGESLTDSVDADDGTIDGSGIGGNSYWAFGTPGFTFTFNASALGALPTYAGIVWTDGEGTTLFSAFDSLGNPLGSIGPVALSDGIYTGGTGEDRFFGVFNATGIGSIAISNTSGGIEVDHLQYGAATAAPPSVPEPATLLLLGSGLVGLGGVAWRRFRRG